MLSRCPSLSSLSLMVTPVGWMKVNSLQWPLCCWHIYGGSGRSIQQCPRLPQMCSSSFSGGVICFLLNSRAFVPLTDCTAVFMQARVGFSGSGYQLPIQPLASLHCPSLPDHCTFLSLSIIFLALPAPGFMGRGQG